MARTRGLTTKGPAIITRNGIVYRTAKIDVSLAMETFAIEGDAAPVVDERLKNIPIEISFTPIGMVTAPIVTALFAPLAMPVGSSLFGDVDVPAVITPLTGKEPLTFHCTGFTSIPDVIWSTQTSRPARGAWIETGRRPGSQRARIVAPRAGRVD